jgi:hypothetical protein
VKACSSRQPVPGGWFGHLDLIDHRYFYREDSDIGGCACGLARDAVAEQLLMWNVNFVDTDFLASLPEFITNGSVTGFMIEKAVLSSIASHGLAINAGIGVAMKTILFKKFNIQTGIRGEPVLYCPQKSNHEAIDGIIVLIEEDKPKGPKHQKLDKKNNAKKGNKEDDKGDDKEDDKGDDKGDGKDRNQKRKLFLFPLQITVALESHSDSHAKFFKHYYDKWTKGLSQFDVVPQFVWITPDREGIENRPASKNEFPEHKERYLHLSKVNGTVWEVYQNARGETG